MMMSSILPDLTTTTTKIHPEPPVDHFDHLPDSLLLIIFNFIGDIKSLGRCSSVSKRFHSLVPQVQNVVVRVDCVISDDDATSSSPSPSPKSRAPFLNLFRIVFGSIVTKPIQVIGSFFGSGGGSKRFSSSVMLTSASGEDDVTGGVMHHSPTQVLKGFNEIKFLKIELPSGELGVDDDVLLRWRADFGSTLDNCVMLGASSVIYPNTNTMLLDNNVNVCNGNGNGNGNGNANVNNGSDGNDNGSIPESFYTNGGLKLRVVWTISSLIAASARHYLLQSIICEHKTLDSLVLTDADGQGVLCMNREQLEELRVKPLSASSASKRTLVPALNMRLWYAPYLELPDGTVLKGATLVATRPSDQNVAAQKDVSDGLWASSAFEEPFGTAAKMLVKRRTYCLEMNSF